MRQRHARAAGVARRGVWGVLAAIAVIGLAVAAGAADKEAKPVGPTAEGAQRRLSVGNQRFRSGKPARPNQDAARRAELAKGQKPFASVLSCADSRVPPEVVFDQGLGDLFVVRTAGEAVDQSALGSLEYGAEHLHIPLLLVLGHERRGAVVATAEAVERGGEVTGGIGFLVSAIKPAVEKAKGQAGDKVHNAIVEQVKQVVAQLQGSKPVLNELVEGGRLKIVGGLYDSDTGAVEFLK